MYWILKAITLFLEYSETASYKEIRAAFRRLAKKYHPDVNSSLYAEETIKKINAAFEILSDKEKRRQYDRIYLNHSITLQKQKEQYKQNDNNTINSNGNLINHKVSQKIKAVMTGKIFIQTVIFTLVFIMILSMVRTRIILKEVSSPVDRNHLL